MKKLELSICKKNWLVSSEGLRQYSRNLDMNWRSSKEFIWPDICVT